jgi:large subunit ribosomal protein L14e
MFVEEIKGCLFSHSVAMGKKSNLVEVGRVALINYGPLAGKSCVILDILDMSRALVEGPQAKTGVARQTMPFRHLSLTKVKLAIPRSIGVSGLNKAYEKDKIAEQLEGVNWVKKQRRTTVRKALNDFDRFKLMLLRKKKSQIVGKAFAKARRAFNTAKGAAAKAKKKAD